jgi:hypothetical protein
MSAAVVSSLDSLYRQMVEAAVLAPSAENLQPWHFTVANNCLTVSLDARRRLPSDVDCMLSLTGIGAAIENAIVAARQQAIEPVVVCRSVREAAPAQPFVEIADIRAGAAGVPDGLYSQIATRCTTRRMEARIVAREVLVRLSAAARAFPQVRIDWVMERPRLRKLAQMVGMGNRIRFEHEPFHREFYESIRFSDERARTTRDGLDARTLQLPLGVQSVLQSLRFWPRMRLANVLGFSRGVARQAAQEVSASGAVGILSVEAPGTRDFVEGGRALERIWLAAQSEKLVFHPTASLPVFLAHANRTAGEALLAKHRRVVSEMSRAFSVLFPHLADRTIQMVFRVGEGAPATVRSLRRPLEDVLSFGVAASEPPSV